MLTKSIALHGMAVLVGGLIATSAMAQTQMASAVPAPQRDVMVFTEKGGQLSPTAASTVHTVAAEAKASQVTLIGRPESVAPVKAALEKAGVPGNAIAVEHASATPACRGRPTASASRPTGGSRSSCSRR